MLKISHIELPVPVILAPMAGITDLPFRLINRSFGAPLAFTEMIDVRAVDHRDKRTQNMLISCPEDRPLGVQLLGSEETHVMKAMDILVHHKFDIIDFNAACPTPKVTKKGKGAALLKEPRKLMTIIRSLVRHFNVPVTLKIRTGWDSGCVNACDVAVQARDAGISTLFIHGRTKEQGYSGTVDYVTIRKVKEALDIPVIASGDNLSLPLIKKTFDETGCDGVVLARGALGNPWIFREACAFYLNETSEVKPPLMNDRIEVIRRHLNLVLQHYGDRRGVGIFHKFFIWYTKGIQGVKPLRDKAFRTNTPDTLLQIIAEMENIRWK